MKFSGIIGFWSDDVETAPGVYQPQIVERKYTGDIITNSRRFDDENRQYRTFNISNRISILADLYSRNNWPSIRYVVWNGIKWRVERVDVNYPRLILDLGDVYNENETSASSDSG